MTAIREQLRQTLITEIAPAFSLDVPLAHQRALLDQMGAASALPDGVEVTERALAGMHAEWLGGPGCLPDAALLYLHGGGFVMGSCASHRSLAAHIVRTAGVQAVVPEYRLAPEHPFPAALEDGIAAYHALLAQGFDPDRLGLVGDSAGGGLTLSVLVALRDAGVPLPRFAVLLSPFTDLTGSGESMRTRASVDPWLSPASLGIGTGPYAGDVALTDPRLSPLFADLRGLPPLLVQVGDHEILLSDATRLADRAREAGVGVELEVEPEVWHVWQLFAPALPEANEALARIGTFVRAHLQR